MDQHLEVSNVQPSGFLLTERVSGSHDADQLFELGLLWRVHSDAHLPLANQKHLRALLQIACAMFFQRKVGGGGRLAAHFALSAEVFAWHVGALRQPLDQRRYEQRVQIAEQLHLQNDENS